MRRAVHIVSRVLRQFGISLSPLQTALVEASFAVVAWIIELEAAISAGTLGLGTAAALVAGAIAIGISVAAGFEAERQIGDARRQILESADIASDVFGLLEIIWL